jgi:DNA uptake protein ComE-like DNA-binding protein
MKSLRTSAIAVAALLAFAVVASAQVGKGILDFNTASQQELTALPHMTPAIVKGIMDKRPFKSQTELNAYLTSQGLQKAQLTDIYGKAFVHLNLNTTTPEEILMIPNVGQRMVKEFEEYRPYKSLAQWRREIGKYFPNNQQEVARMEKYVFVPINLNTASDEDILTIPGVGARTPPEVSSRPPPDSV